jgi:hypothetical protein
MALKTYKTLPFNERLEAAVRAGFNPKAWQEHGTWKNARNSTNLPD